MKTFGKITFFESVCFRQR